ncbi:hypothetical protein [Microbacterium aurantiacum]|uniref:C2H2-type domain-containing protein n=1 Tax=Microbacterium aurantiacum TaxID=162393 RepID=A0ABT8FRG9_9MICO|nr:hypothetical protein [Microbacterium aurantiacum]MDN4463913.1 hypothetical protein [Microbacterium aurantiacum]
MSTQTFTGQLTVQTCCVCGIAFGVEARYDAARREDHKTFYCSAGHGQSYTGKTEAQKLREQLATAERRRGWAEAILTSTRDQLAATERSLRGHKAAKTRIKNRIAAGVCPCCSRTFQNLSRHMAGQHPDFPTTEEL